MMNEQAIMLIVELVGGLSPNKILALASRFCEEPIPQIDNGKIDLIGSKNARENLERLVKLCEQHGISGEILSAIMMSSGAARDQALQQQSIDFVWTGPTTEFVATRRTEQVLLDMIQKTQEDLFMVSFVAYDVKSITEKLRGAVQRGVRVSILLEEPESEGGSVSHDSIGVMRKKIPGASLYAWKSDAGEFEGGKVHAKIVVADGEAAFLTSANLTGHAMQKNMEAGFLVSGGVEPARIRSHLQALIDISVLTPV